MVVWFLGNFQVCSPAKHETLHYMKKTKSWEDAGPLQVKYLVNAEPFEHNLQNEPLILDFLFGRHPILKERVFKQCTATKEFILV